MFSHSRGPQCSLGRENYTYAIWRHKRHERATSHLVQGRPSCFSQVLKQPSSFVLTSLCPSTYPEGTPPGSRSLRPRRTDCLSTREALLPNTSCKTGAHRGFSPAFFLLENFQTGFLGLALETSVTSTPEIIERDATQDGRRAKQ